VLTIDRSNLQISTGAAWLPKTILAVLFFGPLIAPLFQASSLALAADSGTLARDVLSRYICPTPAKSYMLVGFPMAVCARCWGATIGLWAAWLLLRPTCNDQRPTCASIRSAFANHGSALVYPWLNSYFVMPWPARLLISALPFLLWAAEIVWWPGAPYLLLLLNGAFAGFWAGLFFCSIWPGLLGRDSCEHSGCAA
jgi:hypothetical protein